MRIASSAVRKQAGGAKDGVQLVAQLVPEIGKELRIEHLGFRSSRLGISRLCCAHVLLAHGCRLGGGTVAGWNMESGMSTPFERKCLRKADLTPVAV